MSSYSREPSNIERQAFEDLIRRLTKRREELGWSQGELNDRLGVADGLVGKWESFGRLPGMFMLACWVSALNVTLVPIMPEPEGENEMQVRPQLGRLEF